MPERLEPMLARTGDLPRDDGDWAYEIKWDGVRAIAFVQGGRLRLQARSGRDITPRYPELRPLAEALAGARGRARRRGRRVRRRAARASRSCRAGCTSPPSTRSGGSRGRTRSHYIAFDLLYLDGRSLMDAAVRPSAARALAELELQGPTWQAPAHHVGDGAALLELTRAQQLEGVIAKRLDSTYTPGRRTPPGSRSRTSARATW